MEQRIKITYKHVMAYNNIKERHVFWEGTTHNIEEVPNPFVKELVKKALQSKKSLKQGIWKINLLKK